MNTPTTETSARFDLGEIARSFPDHAETMLLDRYLVDRDLSSTRVFRAYQPTPAHFHQHSDEHLLVLSGRGAFWMDEPSSAAEFAPGTLLFFRRGTVHAMPAIFEAPVCLLAIDVPRRDPADVHFVNPADGSPATFIANLSPEGACPRAPLA